MPIRRQRGDFSKRIITFCRNRSQNDRTRNGNLIKCWNVSIWLVSHSVGRRFDRNSEDNTTVGPRKSNQNEKKQTKHITLTAWKKQCFVRRLEPPLEDARWEKIWNSWEIISKIIGREIQANFHLLFFRKITKFIPSLWALLCSFWARQWAISTEECSPAECHWQRGSFVKEAYQRRRDYSFETCTFFISVADGGTGRQPDGEMMIARQWEIAGNEIWNASVRQQNGHLLKSTASLNRNKSLEPLCQTNPL